MPRLLSWWLILLLAATMHLDWHFARPTHHRLSLGWSSHWLFAMIAFVAAGCYIARRWPSNRWTAAAVNVGLALFVAQVVEPIATTLFYDGVFEYSVEPERWVAFWESLGAAVPALLMALWLTRPTTGASSRVVN